MNEVSRRPFHAEYAGAFDDLIDRPVRKEFEAVASCKVILRPEPGGSAPSDAACKL
jgi:hypothetical protein